MVTTGTINTPFFGCHSMKIAKVLSSIVFLLAAASARADQPDEGALFWWEMGVLMNIQSQLAACNDLYPALARQNNYAYLDSVFANSVYDAALRQYPDQLTDDSNLDRLLAVVLEIKNTIKNSPPQVQNRLCSEFTKRIEELTRVAFGMSSTAIKQHFIERRKSDEK